MAVHCSYPALAFIALVQWGRHHPWCPMEWLQQLGVHPKPAKSRNKSRSGCGPHHAALLHAHLLLGSPLALFNEVLRDNERNQQLGEQRSALVSRPRCFEHLGNLVPWGEQEGAKALRNTEQSRIDREKQAVG